MKKRSQYTRAIEDTRVAFGGVDIKTSTRNALGAGRRSGHQRIEQLSEVFGRVRDSDTAARGIRGGRRRLGHLAGLSSTQLRAVSDSLAAVSDKLEDKPARRTRWVVAALVAVGACAAAYAVLRTPRELNAEPTEEPEPGDVTSAWVSSSELVAVTATTGTSAFSHTSSELGNQVPATYHGEYQDTVASTPPDVAYGRKS